MRSYRFARRSFLAGIGGAFGLRILLEDFEAMAQGMKAPPRFLMTHWPVGTVKARFMPTGSGGALTGFSPILKPFETAGLKDYMSVIYGLSDNGRNQNGGGGHEAGTPLMTTGADCPGTRKNGGEGDDGVAGGPSWDQIFLKKVADLQRPGAGYANALCDERIDSNETSTRCLSYSYDTQSIPAANKGGNVTEHKPLLPELSPAQLYLKLFSGFMGGGPMPANQEAAKRALIGRKSVLDYSMSELAELRRLVPGEEGKRLDIHTDAIRKVEMQISDLLNGKVITQDGCVVPAQPDANIKGKTGSKFDYNSPEVKTGASDEQIHEQIGKLHAAVLLAAFQCDIIRVGTFQWSPGTNHVSFKGMYPGSPNAIYMHHPLTHRPEGSSTGVNLGDTAPANNPVYEFMANVQTWYNEKTADVINLFKNADDPFGGKMLDTTIIPYVSEVAESGHSRREKQAMIFGGKALGMQGAKFANFASRPRNHNDFWLTIAQAYFKTTDPLAMLTDEVFVKDGAKPIEGLWMPPA